MACKPKIRSFFSRKFKKNDDVSSVVDCDRQVDVNKEKHGKGSNMNSSAESNKVVNDTCSSSRLNVVKLIINLVCRHQSRNIFRWKFKNDNNNNVDHIDECNHLIDLIKERNEACSMNTSMETCGVVNEMCSPNSLLVNASNENMLPPKLDKSKINVHFEDSEPPINKKPTKKPSNKRKIDIEIRNDVLNLSHKCLDCIPNLKDKSITKIILNDNKIDSLDNFPVLSQLESCLLQRNCISNIPLQLVKCCALKVIDLRFNKIRVFPDYLCDLPHLEVLLLSSNKIDVIPDSVERLKKLKHLVMENNKISRIPPQLFQLRELTSINLSFNKIEWIPPVHVVLGLSVVGAAILWTIDHLDGSAELQVIYETESRMLTLSESPLMISMCPAKPRFVLVTSPSAVQIYDAANWTVFCQMKSLEGSSFQAGKFLDKKNILLQSKNGSIHLYQVPVALDSHFETRPDMSLDLIDGGLLGIMDCNNRCIALNVRNKEMIVVWGHGSGLMDMWRFNLADEVTDNVHVVFIWIIWNGQQSSSQINQPP